jgi:bifunctional pyridoxal-dependent enzyme with beta-cystathionase and maltose regulon repressor activities
MKFSDICKFCSCYTKPPIIRQQYLFRTTNKFLEVEIPAGTNKTVNDLDTDNMSVWVADRDFKLIHATNDSINDLKEHQYIGKLVKDVDPQDFANYLLEYHKLAQEGIETKMNLVMNGFLVYIKLRPLRFINEEVIGSVLYIIPYKL